MQLTQIAITLLAVGIAGFIAGLLKKLGVQVSTEQNAAMDAAIVQFVRDAVKWAEQKLKDKSGSEKRDKVMELMIEKFGGDVADNISLVDCALEAAVFDLKK
jgi:hypothetical protein